MQLEDLFNDIPSSFFGKSQKFKSINHEKKIRQQPEEEFHISSSAKSEAQRDEFRAGTYSSFDSSYKSEKAKKVSDQIQSSRREIDQESEGQIPEEILQGDEENEQIEYKYESEKTPEDEGIPDELVFFQRGFQQEEQ